MITLLFRYEPYDDQLEQPDQDSGNHAAHKQLAHRYAGYHGKHQHGNGGRDDHADGRRGHRDAGGKILGIALLDHIGDQDGAESGGIGDGGTGDASEDHGGDHVDLAEAAAEGLADQ